MQQVTPEYLFKLERFAANSTPGPWYWCAGVVCKKQPSKYCEDCGSHDVSMRINSRFIAASREAIPALIARIRKLEAEKAWLAEQCVKFGDKTPRESAAYWLDAADRETQKAVPDVA